MFKLRNLLIVIFSFYGMNLNATHIVGGEMTYQRIGTNTYKIRLDVYIDCINGSTQAIASDAQAVIGVFYGNSKTIVSGYPISVDRSGPVKVEKTNYNCIAVAPNACVNHYWYETTLTLSSGTGGYYISFQRCCRNGTINNIVNPGGTGADYWVFIPDAKDWGKENSSAVFNELPPNYLCTNTPLKFDHSAKDADGDSLVYSLVTPYTGGSTGAPRPDNAGSGTLENPPFSQIQWNSGYSAAYPIDGNPGMSIDPQTGLLTLVPTRVGQFVVGIKVTEYRKGKYVSQVIRDYQFNVQSCVIDVVASYFVPKVICGYKFQFKNLSAGAQRYHWDFGVPGVTNDTANVSAPIFTFPKAGIYKVRLYAYKNKCVDSFNADLTVNEPQKPKLPNDTILCPNVTMKLKSSLKADSYSWSTGATIDSIKVTKSGTYILSVNIKGCVWSDTMNIGYDFNKIKAYGDTMYCSDDQFSRSIFAVLTGKSTFYWSTGETTPTITVSKPNSYIVTGTTENGCISKDTVVVSKYSPVTVSIRDTTVCYSYSTIFNSNISDPAAIITWSNGATGKTMTTSKIGVYTVRVQIGKCSDIDTFNLSNWPNEYHLGKDLVFCQRIDTLLTLNFPNISNVVWNNENPGSTFRLTKAGKLYAQWLNSHNCLEKDSINVTLYPNPPLDLGPDTSMCVSQKPVLDAGFGMRSYLWNTGSKDQTITVIDSGRYWVKITDNQGCSSSDTVLIQKKRNLYPSDIYMPNAFTPDNNGRNDLYPLNQYQLKGGVYNLKLYNRWGEKIAEYTSPDQNWDGNINGKPAEEGVYVYYLNFIGCDNFMKTMVGDFTLLR